MDLIHKYHCDQTSDWASLILLRVVPDVLPEHIQKKSLETPAGYVNIRNRNEYGPYASFKLTSGQRQRKSQTLAGNKWDQDPYDTAAREVAGECDIHISRDNFKHICNWWNRNHWKYLFVADVPMSEALRVSGLYTGDSSDAPSYIGNDGEEPYYFSVQKFWECIDSGRYFEPHYRLLQKTALIVRGSPR